MRVLVTGAGGFVGRRLCRRLRELGHEVFAAMFEPPEEADERTTRIDVGNADSVRAAVAWSRPDRVVHLAALSHVGSSWGAIPDYFRVNVVGTENVLEAADVPVVFSSSAEVYGVVPDGELPISESRAPAPASPYALTKAAAERLVLRHGGVVVRPFNMVGPGQSKGFALPAFAAQLAEIDVGDAPPVLRVGNLEARRDFVHVDDGVDGFAVAVERGQPGDVVNIATGRSCSVRQVVDLLLTASGVRARVEVDPERIRPVDIPDLAGDPSRLESLGWRRRHSLEVAVDDLWAEQRRAIER